MRKCPGCGVAYEATIANFYRNKSMKDGLTSRCKKCDNTRRAKAMRDARPLKYGITWEDYDRMLAEQDGKCAICFVDDPGATRTVWCIDHDHQTGEVRGLLCNQCNVGLGAFRDNIAHMTRAQAYLEKVPSS